MAARSFSACFWRLLASASLAPSLSSGDLGLELLVAAGERELALLLDLVALGEVLGLEAGQVGVARSSSTQVTRLAAK
jgi:hypothetical protein